MRHCLILQVVCTCCSVHPIIVDLTVGTEIVSASLDDLVMQAKLD